MLKDQEHQVEEQKKEEGLSRRKMLGLGAAAVGAVAAGGLINASPALSDEIVNLEINGKKIVTDVPARIINNRTVVPVRVVSENLGAKVDWVDTTKTVKITTSASAPAAAPALPWNYQKLDVEAVRKAGYDLYKKGGCMYGAAAALINEMSKTPGTAWNSIPLDMFKYGEGGAYGWGTLCGAINGALQVMAMAAGKNADMGSTFMGWYSDSPFPSDKHEAYTKFKAQKTSVSKSPLCHASVTNWCDATGFKVGSDERKERCAKLTGDCAAFVAQLMNDKLEKKPDPKYTYPAEYISCMGCHNGATSLLDNEQGKMNCVSCHDDDAFKQVPHNLK